MFGICKCNRCGKGGRLIQIYDDEFICDECLDSDFEQCDICGQYWENGSIGLELVGGQFICEYCLEEMEDDDDE